jgi:hypothetical protein
MKVKIRDLKKLFRENVKKALKSEDVDRLRRADLGQGESEFDEAVDCSEEEVVEAVDEEEPVTEELEEVDEDRDRLSRSARGHGESEFEEAAEPFSYSASVPKNDPMDMAARMTPESATFYLNKATKSGDVAAQKYWGNVLAITQERDNVWAKEQMPETVQKESLSLKGILKIKKKNL